MSNVLIIGYGVVGKNLHKEIEVIKPDIYDKYKHEQNTRKQILYDIAFICVDTPISDDSNLDYSEVRRALYETNSKIYVIKSTVPVGTTKKLIYESGLNIVFSPEYYGGTQHCNNYQFNYTILGGDKNICYKVQQLLQNVYDARHKFYITNSDTAELTKFMENSYLAAKVSFCVQFYEIAKQLGVDYEELRELFILDERVGASHTFVYDEKPYWDSHCLNKDVPAIAISCNARLLKEVIRYNNDCIKKFKR